MVPVKVRPGEIGYNPISLVNLKLMSKRVMFNQSEIGAHESRFEI